MIYLPQRFLPVVLALLAVATGAHAQFKEVGPPPYSPAVARQKIRSLLEKADPANPQPAVDALLGLVPWYRDLIDQELIASWKGDGRANLPRVIDPLADKAVASAIVEYSWREAPQATMNLTYAPLLGQLMARYPDSAQPFLADLLGPTASGRTAPDLTASEAEGVCRILLDMPDLGTWHKTALQILPRYRQVAENLLNQDLRGDDREKAYRARIWLSELRGDEPGIANQPQIPRRPPRTPPTAGSGPPASRPSASPSPPIGTADGRPTLARADSPTPPAADAAPAPAPRPPSLYSGARSGALQCSGGPVAQNAEYVFRDLPAGKLQLDYDTRIWDARLAPGEGQTQKLILRNKSSGPQKRCSVHWSLSP